MKATDLAISVDGRYLIIRVPIEYIPDRGMEGPTRVDDLLTDKELAAFELAVEGKCNKEIAVSMKLSIRTVKFHLSQIYAKLNLDNRLDLMRTYRKRPVDVYAHKE
jgi:DNA-binding NarL/FixJ family response regulator